MLGDGPAPKKSLPSRADAMAFAAKAALFRLDRARRDIVKREVRRFGPGTALSEAPVVAESKTKLWTEASDAERPLLVGKIHNLRAALRRIDGIEIPAGRIFGFWAHIGRPTRRRGFVAGRELREGCVIPSVGGGLCQLSNALYDAALKAGFEIVERHAHTQVIPGSLAEVGRDATVFWNYVDLRFRAAAAFRIEADMDAEHLVIRFRALAATQAEVSALSPVKPQSAKGPNNCLSCNVIQCFRHVAPAARKDGETALLLDGFVPEFDGYIKSIRRGADHLFIPLDGARFRKPNYAWTTSGFASVRTSTLATLIRAWKSRRLAAQGAKRQRALLDTAERLAASYARRLPPEATHVVVAQNLLPHLWGAGHLKGRSFDVLMTALPMGVLQQRLDRAAQRHPQSNTLGDFRADPALVAAEAAALERARKIVTPHADIAALFPLKAVHLDWVVPRMPKAIDAVAADKPRIVFPAATLARKGARELRDALQGLDVTLVVAGAEHEGADFWSGFDVERRGGAEILTGASLVVLPAFVEHNPRLLLRALSAGVPVIATRECGIARRPGLTQVQAGDVTALSAAIILALFGEPRKLAKAA